MCRRRIWSICHQKIKCLSIENDMLIKPKYEVIIFLKYLIIFSCGMGLAFHTVLPVCKLHHSNEMSLNSKNWVKDKCGLGFEKPYGEQVPPTPRALTWLDLLGIVKPKKVGKGLCYHPQTHTPHDNISQHSSIREMGPQPRSLLQFSCPFMDSNFMTLNS